MNDLATLSKLVERRNAIDREIAVLIGRPTQLSHVGEYLASVIFGIRLEESASRPGIDGYVT